MPRKKGVSLSVGRGEKSKKGGLTAKGRAKYNRATGSNLQAPVTKKSGLHQKSSQKKIFLCSYERYARAIKRQVKADLQEKR